MARLASATVTPSGWGSTAIGPPAGTDPGVSTRRYQPVRPVDRRSGLTRAWRRWIVSFWHGLRGWQTWRRAVPHSQTSPMATVDSSAPTVAMFSPKGATVGSGSSRSGWSRSAAHADRCSVA